MHNIFKKIALTLLAGTLLLSCSTMKEIFSGDKKEYTGAIDVAPTEEWIPAEPATELEFVIDFDENVTDSCNFDVPESMTANTDSLLSTWQARTLLKKLDCNTSGWENISMTDTMYAKRLASMPTIVRMP